MYSGSSLPIIRLLHSKSLCRSSLRHAEHLGDHLQRELGGDVDDEVALAALDHVVEDLGCVSSRMCGSSCADLARREAAVDELAVPRVLRRVHREHHQPLLLDLLGRRLVDRDAGPLARVVGPVRADGPDVGVLGDAPVRREQIPARVEVHRGLAPEELELVEGDALDERVEVRQVDVGERQVGGGGHVSASWGRGPPDLKHVTISPAAGPAMAGGDEPPTPDRGARSLGGTPCTIS